ncbi:MAG: ABC transporter permease, partial [Holophagales bacterium]|nr:ABC transporter permease [Holophagales bacterium]
PMTPGGWWTSYRTADRPLGAGEQAPSSSSRLVTPGYFSTLRIPLLGGRDFGSQDTAETERVLIVNERLADEAWPGENPVGKVLFLGRAEPVAHTVVGVVGTVRQSALGHEGHPEVYVPASQSPARRMYLAARFTSGADRRLAEVRAAVASIDPAVPISNLGLLEEPVARSIAGPRLQTWLMSALAFLGLALGVLGVYGVMLYLVSARFHEIGVRLALGQTPRGVLASTVLRGAAPVALGLLVGLAAARLGASLLASSLYEITATDPLTFSTVPAILGAVALLAVFLPALRASRLDPVQILRQG